MSEAGVTELAVAVHNGLQSQCDVYGRLLAALTAENQALRAQLTMALLKENSRVDGFDDLFECAACSVRPGAAQLCARCVEARRKAGATWRGPRLTRSQP